jgi:hypothetical protein
MEKLAVIKIAVAIGNPKASRAIELSVLKAG